MIMLKILGATVTNLVDWRLRIEYRVSSSYWNKTEKSVMLCLAIYGPMPNKSCNRPEWPVVMYYIVLGSRRPPDALQPKAYCTNAGL